ncbi:ubiquitin-like-specific protease 1A [Rosa chinensis]|uniref:ubiquitin-like-specific protease 1A n=1 Tax=Rosa chinensis TaxID=74649 RepID=UPI001AD91B35|nr:ubiquitin-like-specific protease 1A [Rosa chinensis]
MCGLKRFHRCLQQCSKIFIPLHDNMEEYWILLVMHLPEKKVEVLDSFLDVRSRERRMDHARDVMAMLQKVFGTETT